jgi:hypothetical protein
LDRQIIYTARHELIVSAIDLKSEREVLEHWLPDDLARL